MTQSEGSEYDRLFYPFLFKGGQADPEAVLVQVRHSTIDKTRAVIDLRRQTLTAGRDRIPRLGAGRHRPHGGSDRGRDGRDP